MDDCLKAGMICFAKDDSLCEGWLDEFLRNWDGKYGLDEFLWNGWLDD
ncbi:MAG: hypothetical protein U9R60_10340 [Bacteroidota bacterium]|nr:hypothetical protein [Bacteroidota bacterium]